MNQTIFEGNLQFLQDSRVVIEMVVPLEILRDLVKGDENRSIQIHHAEIVHLLCLIFLNLDTPEPERIVVKGLLEDVLGSAETSVRAKEFVRQVLTKQVESQEK